MVTRYEMAFLYHNYHSQIIKYVFFKNLNIMWIADQPHIYWTGYTL